MILLAVEFSLHTNFVRGVALNAYKSSNQLATDCCNREKYLKFPNFNAPARVCRVTPPPKKKIQKIIPHISYLKPIDTLKSIFLQKWSALMQV